MIHLKYHKIIFEYICGFQWCSFQKMAQISTLCNFHYICKRLHSCRFGSCWFLQDKKKNHEPRTGLSGIIITMAIPLYYVWRKNFNGTFTFVETFLYISIESDLCLYNFWVKIFYKLFYKLVIQKLCLSKQLLIMCTFLHLSWIEMSWEKYLKQRW